MLNLDKFVFKSRLRPTSEILVDIISCFIESIEIPSSKGLMLHLSRFKCLSFNSKIERWREIV